MLTLKKKSMTLLMAIDYKILCFCFLYHMKKIQWVFYYESFCVSSNKTKSSKICVWNILLKKIFLSS